MRLTCLIMAGGKSSRFGSQKLAAEVCGRPLLEHSLRASREFCSFAIIAVSEKTVEALEEKCSGELAECIEMGGHDYVEDLSFALSALRKKPVLVLPGDAVFRDIGVLERFVEEALGKDADVVTMIVEGLGPVGVSLFKTEGGSWADLLVHKGDVVDVDFPGDLEAAEDVCRSNEGSRGEGA